MMKVEAIYGGRKAPIVVQNTVQGEGMEIYDLVRQSTYKDFTFLSIGGIDWNHDMSPWDAPPMFPKDEGFTAGADDHLERIVGEILPKIIEEHDLEPEYMMLSGYSLAGLFAIYSLYRTDMFSRIVSASGSLWFPGLMDFVRNNSPMRVPDVMYLSLGDREARTRNPTLGKVRENTENLARMYSDMGVDTMFELNPGNHFMDPEGRMAKGIAYALSR